MATTRTPRADTDFITRRQYDCYTDAEWHGVKVELRNPIENGNAKYPEGMVLTISRKRTGFELVGPTCECCGLKPKISSVNPMSLRIVE